MKARLAIYDPTVQTRRGVLQTTKLSWSHEVGGGGDLQFSALDSLAVPLGVNDCTAIIELETAPSTWTPIPHVWQVLSPIKRPKLGLGVSNYSGEGLFQAWAAQTIIFPEYVGASMARPAGMQRGLGWMSTAYDPGADPREDWDQCYQSSRSTFPDVPEAWPSASNAKWISCTDYTTQSERKLFRSEFTLSELSVIRVYFTSDEGASVWVGGELIIVTDDIEVGYKEWHSYDMILDAGTYAVAIDTKTHYTAGGNGEDPVALAICTLDNAGDIDTWELVTDDWWYACRRDDEGPGSEPPGPTPGQLITMLVDEAADRGAVGWDYTSDAFNDVQDSNGGDWLVSSERFVRYALDTYKTFFDALAETECDCWLDNNLNLYAAKVQGTNKLGVTIGVNNVITMSDSITSDLGNVVVALTLDGWVQREQAGFRREFGLETGQAISKQMGWRICDAALADDGRWDGSVKIKEITGAVPYIDFGVGDNVTVAYQGLSGGVRVLSIAAETTEGGVGWSLEVTEAADFTRTMLMRAAL